ncbi:MAG: SRPBCC family protein, partial [Candidatus Hodarchaeales archaeon]
MSIKFKWPVSVSITIDAPIASVWEIITQPGHLNLFHPFCKENTVIKWSDKDSSDIIVYYSGWEFERNFFEWETEKGYKL